MTKLLTGILSEIKLRGALLGPCPFLFVPGPGAFRRRPGQTTVEYLLMLAVVASMSVIMAVLFHKRILGGVFTLVGMIIGAGQPK